MPTLVFKVSFYSGLMQLSTYSYFLLYWYQGNTHYTDKLLHDYYTVHTYDCPEIQQFSLINAEVECRKSKQMNHTVLLSMNAV